MPKPQTKALLVCITLIIGIYCAYSEYKQIPSEPLYSCSTCIDETPNNLPMNHRSQLTNTNVKKRPNWFTWIFDDSRTAEIKMLDFIELINR